MLAPVAASVGTGPHANPPSAADFKVLLVMEERAHSIRSPNQIPPRESAFAKTGKVAKGNFP
jgi:hypothetical protein